MTGCEAPRYITREPGVGNRFVTNRASGREELRLSAFDFWTFPRHFGAAMGWFFVGVLVVLLLGGFINGLRAWNTWRARPGEHWIHLADAPSLTESNRWIAQLEGEGINARAHSYLLQRSYQIWVERSDIDRAREMIPRIAR
jgi:hypothetical protein